MISKQNTKANGNNSRRVFVTIRFVPKPVPYTLYDQRDFLMTMMVHHSHHDKQVFDNGLAPQPQIRNIRVALLRICKTQF